MASKHVTPDFDKLPDSALLPVAALIQPYGPVPYRRTAFLDAVRRGDAPRPVLKTHKCTRWRWGDIREWLDKLAQRAG